MTMKLLCFGHAGNTVECQESTDYLAVNHNISGYIWL